MLMCNQGLYNLCLCAALLVCQSASITEDRCYWRITTEVAHTTICLSSLTGCQSAAIFFFSTSPLYLHRSFPRACASPPRRNKNDAKDAAAAVIAGRLSSRRVGGRRLPVRLSQRRAGDTRGLRRVCRRGNKARRPTDLTPLSSRYQSPHTHA